MIRKISDIQLPSELFKYREWNNPLHQKTIKNYQIYFPRPSAFNDPFDSSIPIRWDLMSIEDCVEQNYEFLLTILKDQDKTEVKKFALKVTNDKSFWHPKKLQKETPEQMERWDKVIGIFSLSENSLNILMWSHYAANHKGFVIGLDSDILSKQCNFDYIEPIIYQNKYPLIEGKDDTNTQFHKKFFYKSNLWEYEKEWRISKNHIENRVVTLSPETYTRIIIGCKTPENYKNEIIKFSKRKLGKNIKIEQAVMSEDKFEIELRRIN